MLPRIRRIPASRVAPWPPSCVKGPLWKAAEQELQGTYDRVMASLKAYEPALATELRDAQRLWIKLREQDCSLYARNRVQGSPWTGFWESECHAQQARARTEWLKTFEE